MASPVPEVLLGIDIGTSGCKATAFSTAGTVIGSGYEAYSLQRPIENWVEQDPERWWDGLVAASRQALADVPAGAVRGIGLSSANALILVDAWGKPIREAIMQLDRRAMKQAEQLRSLSGPHYELPYGGALPEAGTHWLPTLLWLRENEPQTWNRIRGLLYPSGWLAARLSGNAAADYSRASTTLMLLPGMGAWSLDLAESIGVSPEWLPPLVDGTVVTGRLLHAPASALGLDVGIPVTVGSMDSAAAALGVGAISPGEVVVALGTSARVMRLSESSQQFPGFITCPYPGTPYFLTIGAVWGAGSAIKWASSRWTGEVDYARLDQALAGRRFMPSGTGVGDLYDFTGAYGYRGDGDPDELALRTVDAVVEATKSKALMLESFTDIPISRFRITGGASRIPTLVRRVGAAMNATVCASQHPEAETRGAAMLAGVASTVYGNVIQAVDAFQEGNAALGPIPIT